MNIFYNIFNKCSYFSTYALLFLFSNVFFLWCCIFGIPTCLKTFDLTYVIYSFIHKWNIFLVYIYKPHFYNQTVYLQTQKHVLVCKCSPFDDLTFLAQLGALGCLAFITLQALTIVSLTNVVSDNSLKYFETSTLILLSRIIITETNVWHVLRSNGWYFTFRPNYGKNSEYFHF